MENDLLESLDSRLRDKLLSESIFRNLAHTRLAIAACAADYNAGRPHAALERRTPANYALVLTIVIARPLSEMKAPRFGRLLNLIRSE